MEKKFETLNNDERQRMSFFYHQWEGFGRMVEESEVVQQWQIVGVL